MKKRPDSPLSIVVIGWYERAGEQAGTSNRNCIRPSLKLPRAQGFA
jgi:hypothetical protein